MTGGGSFYAKLVVNVVNLVLPSLPPSNFKRPVSARMQLLFYYPYLWTYYAVYISGGLCNSKQTTNSGPFSVYFVCEAALVL